MTPVRGKESDRWLARVVTILFWGGILLGLCIPWFASIAVDLWKHGHSMTQGVRQVQLHLFAPGYNLFLVGLLNAIPFVLFSVFALFHLGLASSDNRRLIRRRATAVICTGLGLIGISAWVQVTTLWYPDAQGALAFVILPLLLTGFIPLGYALGRLIGALIFR
ncbi:conserved membrane protein of unknown function [Nitrospira sp. KM1]|uniref:hypothetical protein n=1 Tax=Nitrospira sp. KM1 TaxID=1936990 RepID=UPI0013A76E92|nr:hypothetical protein [Nitrospira sp. KM1]BCA56308.1 conserved membrane protein of unknown function [Nitrospira sp. KM1]